MDPELSAMQKITEALSGLDEEIISRVLDWTFNRYKPNIKKTSGPETTPSTTTLDGNREESFENFAELFNAANPKSKEDCVLVAAYWMQEIKKEKITTLPLNKELKYIGKNIEANIDKVYEKLLGMDPKPIILLRKNNGTTQGRKEYKLTPYGKNQVTNMINSNKK